MDMVTASLKILIHGYQKLNNVWLLKAYLFIHESFTGSHQIIEIAI